MTPGEECLLRLLSSVARSVSRGKLGPEEVARGVWLDFTVWPAAGLVALGRSS